MSIGSLNTYVNCFLREARRDGVQVGVWRRHVRLVSEVT